VLAEETPKFPIVKTCIAGLLYGVVGGKVVIAVVLQVDSSNLYFPPPVLEVVFWVFKGAVDDGVWVESCDDVSGFLSEYDSCTNAEEWVAALGFCH